MSRRRDKDEAGLRFAGGCDMCDAVQHIRPHARNSKIMHVTIEHDEQCGRWLAIQQINSRTSDTQ